MSFAGEIKSDLCMIQVKNKCCQKSFLRGALLFSGEDGDELYARQNRNKEVFDYIASVYSETFPPVDMAPIKVKREKLTADFRRCEACNGVFLRGLFLVHGSITHPVSSYYLNFSFVKKEDAQSVSEILAEHGISAKTCIRRKRYIVYLKQSESIEDLLVTIGANAAAFTIMNTKITGEFKNQTNRARNCDAHNLTRSVDAAQKQLAAIRKLIEAGKLDTLTQDLKETAMLRFHNEEMTLSQLSMISHPKMTKSGLNHRLYKIIEIAENL